MEATHEPQPEIETPAGNGSGIDLRVTVRDKDGKIINEQCKEGDLYLYNWAVWLMNFLKYGFNGKVTTKTYYGLRRDNTQLTTTGSVYPVNNGNWWAGGGKIQLGSSQQVASILDFAIAVPVQEITPGVPVIVSAGNVVKVIISGTASFVSQTIVSEAGLVLSDPNSTGNGNKSLVTRDTFTPVSVPAGGSITLQFELWFNGMPS